MSRLKSIQKFFAFAFTGVVLFTVSAHEVHYLFSSHRGLNEQCENHLHNDGEHEGCLICKFNVCTFTDYISAYYLTLVVTYTLEILSVYISYIGVVDLTANTQRGPP